MTFIDAELVDTLKLIVERYEGRTNGSVFILLEDFPWYEERNGQLTRLCQRGLITKPRFYDDGAEITLTRAGRHFFDERESVISLDKEDVYRILSSLKTEMKEPEDHFGFESGQCRGAIKQLQEQGFISGVVFAENEWDTNPQRMWIERGYITVKGLQFISDYQTPKVSMTNELIAICAKIADNPASYNGFDEDGLNREVRNLLDMAITRFGYSVSDQMQQGLA